MKDAQKKLILWSLVIFAILFHVLFCEWEFFWKSGDRTGASIAWLWNGLGSDSDIELYAHGESTLLAISLGIVLPLLLLIARIYLQLGWFNSIFVGSWLRKVVNKISYPDDQEPPT